MSEKQESKNLQFAKGADERKDEKQSIKKNEKELPQGDKERFTPVLETESHVSYLGVALEKATAGDEKLIPKKEQYEDYINERFSLELQKKFAISMSYGDPILIEGGTSIGKTTTVRKMCAELNWEVHYINLNGATDVESLMGRYIPNPFKIDRKNFTPEEYQKILSDWRKHTSDMDPILLTNREFIFADGKVTSGLRQKDSAIKVIILDELNSAKPEVLIRLHEVIDAIEKDGTVILSEDANESISVSKKRTKIVGLMNPPGAGFIGREPMDPAQLRRWVYQKEATELPDDTFSFSIDAMFQLAQDTDFNMEKKSFLFSRDEKLAKEQLANIPGIKEILILYKEFHKTAKELVKNRSVAADQPQKFTYDDREEPKRVMNFILRFYNGDIAETVQKALEYYYAGKVESDEDKEKIRILIQNIKYAPKENSKRKKIGDASTPGTKKEKPEESATTIPKAEDSMEDKEKMESKKLTDEIRKRRERIKATGKLPEDFFGESGIEFPSLTPEVFSSPESEKKFFEHLHGYWSSYYISLGLPEMASALPATIEIASGEKERFLERIKQGYIHATLLPPNPDQYADQIKQETEKPLDGLPEKQQYSEEGTYLDSDVTKVFPDKIRTLNRPSGKPYILLTHDTPEVDPETLGKTAEFLRSDFKSKGLKSLTSTEYLIKQREYTQRHLGDDQPHIDTSKWNWLLDSEFNTSSGDPQVLSADWYSGSQQVLLSSGTSGHSYSTLGARSSDIFEL